MEPNNTPSNSFNKAFILLGLLFADIITAVILLIAVINIPHIPSIVGKYSLDRIIEIDAKGRSTVKKDPYKDYGIEYTVEFLEDGTGEMVASSGSMKEAYSFTWTDSIIELDMGSNRYASTDMIQTMKLERSDDGMEVCLLNEGAHTSVYTSTDSKACFTRVTE